MTDSLRHFEWNILPNLTQEEYDAFPELTSLLALLIHHRGVCTSAAVDEYLAPDYETDLHDPMLFSDMTKALDRLLLARDKDELVVVHGDYDVDGMTGAAVILEVFKLVGVRAVGFIPNRYKDGYGISKETLDRFIDEEKASLLVTVDCGISNAEQITHALERGMETIITDHHHVPENVPPAVAIIHPLAKDSTYPYRHLTGVAVAYKLAVALVQRARKEKLIAIPLGYEKWMLDLVALGTVADCGDLLGENRTLLHFGLKVLAKTKRPGLRSLIAHAGCEIDTISEEDIGWALAPRINAPSRVEDPLPSFHLLCADSQDEGDRFAWKLEEYNTERRALSDQIRLNVVRTYGEGIATTPLIFAVGDDWREGVLGLVAGRLMEEYQVPVILFTRRLEGEVTGSSRSPLTFNIIEHLTEAKELITRFGGHAQAAGLTVSEDKIEELEKALMKRASDVLAEKTILPIKRIDCELEQSQLTWDTYDTLQCMRPFGYGNEEPLFLIKNLKLLEVRTVGQDKTHLRLQFERHDGGVINGIAFGLGSLAERLENSSSVDVLVHLSLNEWQGKRELQLRVIDIDFPS